MDHHSPIPPANERSDLPIASRPPHQGQSGSGPLSTSQPNRFAPINPSRQPTARPSSDNPFAAPSVASAAETLGGDDGISERQRLTKLAHGFRFFSMCYPVFILFLGLGFMGFYDVFGLAFFAFCGMWLATIGMLNRCMKPVEGTVFIFAAFIPCLCLLPMLFGFQIARADLVKNGIPIGLFGPPRRYIVALEQGHELPPATSHQDSAVAAYLVCALFALLAGLIFFR